MAERFSRAPRRESTQFNYAAGPLPLGEERSAQDDAGDPIWRGVIYAGRKACLNHGQPSVVKGSISGD